LLVNHGAIVVYDNEAEIHVSGHARQEELKLVHAMVKPKYFMPVHGEVRMLHRHAALAQQLGMPVENIFVLENGQVLELTKSKAEINGNVTVGKIMIDGMGLEDVGNMVLKDRRQLSQDGIMVVIVTVNHHGIMVAKPEMISRGFVYLKEAEELMGDARKRVTEQMVKYEGRRIKDFSAVKQDLKECVGKVLYQAVKRKPMIIPVIIELD
ncbi:MAG: ribonuclease J, partial [Clostridiales bacterium]